MKIERADEQFAREKIIEYCQCIPTNIIYESNGSSKAPDYEIYVDREEGTRNINLEITTVYGMELNSDGLSIRKRLGVDPLQGFNESLQNKAQHWVKKGEKFFVNCHSRLPNKKLSKIPLYKWIEPLNKKIERLDIENKIPVRYIVPINDTLEDSISRYTSSFDKHYFSIELRGEMFEFSISKVIYEDISVASDCIDISSISKSPNPLIDYPLQFQALFNLQNSIIEKEKKII